MPTQRVSGNTRVTVLGLRALSGAVRAGGLSGSAGADLSRRLKEAAELTASVARANASFSDRIPGSIKVMGGRSGVIIRAGNKNAPHARAFELGLRHPLFGKWVALANPDALDTKHIPFLEDAADSTAEAAAEIVARAVDDWAFQFGYR